MMKRKKVIEGRLTSGFGGRRHPVDGSYKVHQGVDIAAVVGTEILAPMESSVVSVYSHPVGGLTLILRSACGGYRFGMCHLSDVVVEIGDMVRGGELVALSGNTGRSTGPHLHYSVKSGGSWRGDCYVGGRYVDPMDFMEVVSDEK